jgi:C-terminal processing protease CtpA/Prc
MKASFFLPLLFLILFTFNCHQKKNTDSEFNLNFEVIENGIPKGWQILNQPVGSIFLDSIIVKCGKYSVSIENEVNDDFFQGISFVFPDRYVGKKISVTGYMKTENVCDGWAGLVTQIFPFRNVGMRKIEVTGSNDWKKYEIIIDEITQQTHQTAISVVLAGKGKIWIDDLNVTIDGKDIGKVKPYEPISFSKKAKNDKEFDKGSNIVFSELNEQMIDDLEILGRIWGLMKYHHPAIAKGKYNWDYELFRMLPEYMNAIDKIDRDDILIKWIKKYGRIPKCRTCQPTPDDAFLKPDLSWIDDCDISLKLKNLLHNIYINRNQGAHYYIDMIKGAGNPYFTNESAYNNMHYPDAGFRLLALYRYWNMIHYFFPYKHLTDKNWNTVFKEYILIFIEAKSRTEYELSSTLLIGEICDSHAFLFGFKEIRKRRRYAFPVQVRFVDNKLVVVEDFYDKNVESLTLKKGDIITHIERKSVESIVESIKKYYPASNEAARMRDIAKEILRSDEQYVHIHYISISSDEPRQRKIFMEGIVRKKINDTDKGYNFIGEKDIGYVDLETLKTEDIPVIKREFMNTKGIIIDFRNGFSDVILTRLISYFYLKDSPVAKFTKVNPDNPGEFNLTEVYYWSKFGYGRTYHGKLVVIVNEEVQSTYEYHTMALQAGVNTTIIGSQTAGADGNVSEIVLPGGLQTMISGIGVYYPDGSETQRVGISLDIEVKPTIMGIMEGRDELLEKAIEIIRQQ